MADHLVDPVVGHPADLAVATLSAVGASVDLAARTLVSTPANNPRYVMTTLAQDDLPQDIDVLRTLVRHNKVQLGEPGN